MEPIIKEQKNYLHFLIPILVSTIIVVGSYFLYQEYQKRQVVPDTPPTTLSSYGLDQPLDPDNRPFGTITYTAETDSLPYVYRLNLEDNTTDLVATQSFTAAVPLSATSSIVIKDNTVALYDHDTETLTTLPHQTNSIITDLTISPDQTRYAYSFRETDIADPENLGAYSIAVHTLGTDQVEVIDGGGKPQWLAESLIYMATASLNQYNFETKKSREVFNLYSPYSIKDDIVMSPDLNNIILTIASSSLISVISVNSNNRIKETDSNETSASSSALFTLIRATPPTRLIELGRIVTSGTMYKNPIFTADSSFYILESQTKDEITVLELRAVNSNKIITKVEVK